MTHVTFAYIVPLIASFSHDDMLCFAVLQLRQNLDKKDKKKKRKKDKKEKKGDKEKKKEKKHKRRSSSSDEEGNNKHRYVSRF